MKQKRTSKKKVSSTSVAVASAEQLKSVITVADAKKENREHKDSVFVDLFYQDETAKKNLLSLYNALHDTEYEDENLVRKVKIDDVLYKNFKNDISFEVNGQVLVFGEHQIVIPGLHHTGGRGGNEGGNHELSHHAHPGAVRLSGRTAGGCGPAL